MHDIYYFTDLHGQKNLFLNMRNWCLEQDAECMIIYGGDACDRGHFGYDIIKFLLEDPHFCYLYGNHEDLFVKAARALLKKHPVITNSTQAHLFLYDNINDDNIKLHLYNGGEDTLVSWLLDGANEKIIQQIENLPRTCSYENIDFCHAGGAYKSFKIIQEQEYNNLPLNTYDETTCIWDRNCIALGWETNRICIHGHTPTILLPNGIYGKNKNQQCIHPCAWQDKLGAKDKRGGWKIDMDTGATWTGRAYILNVSTLKVYGFYDENIVDSSKPITFLPIESYNILAKS